MFSATSLPQCPPPWQSELCPARPGLGGYLAQLWSPSGQGLPSPPPSPPLLTCLCQASDPSLKRWRDAVSHSLVFYLVNPLTSFLFFPFLSCLLTCGHTQQLNSTPPQVVCEPTISGGLFCCLVAIAITTDVQQLLYLQYCT